MNPRHPGEIAGADAVAEEINPVCGDRIRLSLTVRDGRIAEARFLAYGCAPTLACGSALAELVTGRSISYASKLTRSSLTQHLDGLPRNKHHAAALAIETLHSALGRLKS